MAIRTPKSRNGRSDQGDSEARSSRDRLLAAASDLMRDGDTLEVSFVDIAARAGANAALIKYYFDNKDGLLSALLDRDCESFGRHLQRMEANSLNPMSKLRIHIKVMVDLYFQYPYINRLLLRMIRTADPEKGAELGDKFLKPSIAFYKALLQEGYACGEFRKIDPVIFHFNIIGACDPFFSAKAVLRYGFDDQEKIKAHFKKRFLEQTTRFVVNAVKA